MTRLPERHERIENLFVSIQELVLELAVMVLEEAVIDGGREVKRCSPERRVCVICWYGPECGPFYGIERTSIDTERPCPCTCHRRLDRS